MSGERCHGLDPEELKYSYDLSECNSEDKVPDFSSINSYSFEPVWKLSRLPLLSSSSDASIDEEKQEQSLQIENTSWCHCGKCYTQWKQKEKVFFSFYCAFLTAIWLPHGQFWAILKWTASLTQCLPLHFY